MQDVGARAGVTARTVSNVLSGKINVRPETRDAVLRAVTELGYQLNVSARGLRTGQTGFITLAIPDLAIDYFSELARSVLVEAERHGWTVVIQQTGARRDRELAVLSGAHRQLSDGLIFQPHALGPGDERVLIGDSPLVLLGDRIFHGPVDHVTMANHAAAAAATQHLVDRHCQHIAAIGTNPQGGPVSAAALRLEGYRATLERNGLPYLEHRVGLATEWHRADGATAMSRLLDADPQIDGVFCFNDTLAFGALHTLSSRGLRVPDDVAVVGFDNVSGAAYAVPGLTTIDPGSRQIAKNAVDLLARQLTDGPSGTPVEIVSDYALIARRSA
jgi:DNA-binding LacI/PurR family transcriptional regulator